MCGRGLMQHVTQQGQVCEIYELYNDAFAASKPYEVIDRSMVSITANGVALRAALYITLHMYGRDLMRYVTQHERVWTLYVSHSDTFVLLKS